MAKPLALFIGGANGAGKSTLRDIDPPPVQRIIDVDRIAKTIDPMNPRAVDAAAMRQAVVAFADAIRSRQSFSYEFTLSGHDPASTLRRCASRGFEVELRFIGTDDPEINNRRIAERVIKGGHFVEPTIVRQRYIQSLANLPAAVAAADRAYIFDNSSSRPRLHLAVVDKRIIERAPPPQWLSEIIPAIDAALHA